jgi:hypothetical protein
MPKTLEQLEAEVARISMEVLIRRFHDYMAAGHVWVALEAPALTSRRANHCSRCLRVRVGESDYWPTERLKGRSPRPE